MSVYDDLKKVRLDLSQIDIGEEIEDLLEALPESKVKEIDAQLADIRERLTRRERVLATTVEILKVLINIGAKVV